MRSKLRHIQVRQHGTGFEVIKMQGEESMHGGLLLDTAATWRAHALAFPRRSRETAFFACQELVA